MSCILIIYTKIENNNNTSKSEDPTTPQNGTNKLQGSAVLSSELDYRGVLHVNIKSLFT